MKHIPFSFEELRMQGDPEADQVIQDLYAKGELASVNELLGLLVKNNALPPNGLPQSVIDYLEQSSALPAWADANKINESEQLFGVYGLMAFAILALSSLPECYVTPSIAEGLSTTQRLTKQAHRRILETGQFVLAVMAPGGLEANGGGIRIAQKVRLMHASIRFLILHTPVGEDIVHGPPKSMQDALCMMSWSKEELGLPINQADLIRTLYTFSYVTLRGWRSFGVEISASQEDAFLHTWKVIGHFMGINAEILPGHYDESEALFLELKEKWEGDTEAGRLLTEAVLKFVSNELPFACWWLPVALLRELIGDQTADLLGVRKLNIFQQALNGIVFWTLRLINRKRSALYKKLPGLRMDHEWISRRLLMRISAIQPEWRDELFEIPDELAKKWNVQNSQT